MTVSKRSTGRQKGTATGLPATLADLGSDPRNPRAIAPEAAKGLALSLEEFGDLSGITFNTRTGQLVCGHQRVTQLRAKYGDLVIQDSAIVTPGGQRFAIRLVDWPLAKQRAANIAANATTIQGTFTPELDLLLNETQQEFGDLYDTLLLDELRAVPVKSSESAQPQAVVPVYQLTVDCANEAEQKALAQSLRARGHTCRASTKIPKG